MRTLHNPVIICNTILEKKMTKKELIEAIKDYDDNTFVKVLSYSSSGLSSQYDIGAIDNTYGHINLVVMHENGL
jgi:hypothetical protein